MDKLSNSIVMGSVITVATLGVIIDHTSHKLPEPAQEAGTQSGGGAVGDATPCGLGGTPCGLAAGGSPCGLGGTPCGLTAGGSPCGLGGSPCGLSGGDTSYDNASPCGLGGSPCGL